MSSWYQMMSQIDEKTIPDPNICEIGDLLL